MAGCNLLLPTRPAMTSGATEQIKLIFLQTDAKLSLVISHSRYHLQVFVIALQNK